MMAIGWGECTKLMTSRRKLWRCKARSHIQFGNWNILELEDFSNSYLLKNLTPSVTESTPGRQPACDTWTRSSFKKVCLSKLQHHASYTIKKNPGLTAGSVKCHAKWLLLANQQFDVHTLSPTQSLQACAAIFIKLLHQGQETLLKHTVSEVHNM